MKGAAATRGRGRGRGGPRGEVGDEDAGAGEGGPPRRGAGWGVWLGNAENPWKKLSPREWGWEEGGREMRPPLAGLDRALYPSWPAGVGEPFPGNAPGPRRSPTRLPVLPRPRLPAPVGEEMKFFCLQGIRPRNGGTAGSQKQQNP